MREYEFRWRGEFSNEALNALHAEAFGHALRDDDWRAQVHGHSLGWVCAYDGEELVGWVNVAWDGGVHAFVLDPVVRTHAQRNGIGARLVRTAAEHARAAGCEWLHVDFDDHLRHFYFDACGFTPAPAGVIDLTATPERKD